MSSDTLRRAAALMRERAEAATPGPWRPDPESPRATRPADCYDVIDGSTLPVVASVTHADAEHIASWHPAVALAAADWLDMASCGACCDDCMADPAADPWRAQAIAVARAYLGEQP